MGLFGLRKRTDEKHQELEPAAELAVSKKEPALLKPRLGLAVQDEHPTVSAVFSIERRVAKNTSIKLAASEAMISNFKSYQGCSAEINRTDGRFTTKVLHSFGNNATKVNLGVKEISDKVYTANYIADVRDVGGGLIDVSVKSGPNKLVATHTLSKGLTAVVLSHERTKADGLYTATAAVNSNQAVRVALAKKVSRAGCTDTYALSCVLPVLPTLSWKHNDITVSATAPVTPNGIGAATISLLWEPTKQV